MASNAALQEAPTPSQAGQAARPFMLNWVEKTSTDRLRSGTLAFSEASGGLISGDTGEPERLETTGDTPEGFDTTFTF